jgi:hypothetical protein
MAYREAIQMMQYRHSPIPAENQRERWTDPAFFWAAAEMGSDLTAVSFEKIEKRWKAEIEKARERIAKGELANEVPKPAKQLPAPERISAAHPKVRALFADLVKDVKSGAA